MKQFISFVTKETKHILRDKRTMLILFGMPIVLMLLFGFAITTDVRNVRTIVVMSYANNATQKVADRLAASEYFKLVNVVSTSDEAKQLIRDQKADLAMVFPEHFGKTKQQIQFIVDGADPNMAQLWTNYARIVITNTKGSVVNTKLLYNPQMRSAYNFVPATIGILLMLICAMMTSISIVRESIACVAHSTNNDYSCKGYTLLSIGFYYSYNHTTYVGFRARCSNAGVAFRHISYLHHLHSSSSCIWFAGF